MKRELSTLETRKKRYLITLLWLAKTLQCLVLGPVVLFPWRQYSWLLGCSSISINFDSGSGHTRIPTAIHNNKARFERFASNQHVGQIVIGSNTCVLWDMLM